MRNTAFRLIVPQRSTSFAGKIPDLFLQKILEKILSNILVEVLTDD